MQHLRSSTSSNLIDSPLDDQDEEVNAETSSPDTQDTSEVTSPDDTEDPVTEDQDNKIDNETVEPADNKEDNVSEETEQTEDQKDTSQETEQTEDQEDTSQETNQTEDQDETSQESTEQVEEETGESQTIIISMPEAPGDEPVTYEYITTVSPSSNDIAVDITQTNTYLLIICVFLLFFTIVCICRYIYKFFSMFF